MVGFGLRVSSNVRPVRYGLTVPSNISHEGITCDLCKVLIYEYETDHDHETDRVRGFVCRRCNFLLGVAGDSPELLRKAALYLENPPRDGSYKELVAKRRRAWLAKPEQRAKANARNARWRERERLKKAA